MTSENTSRRTRRLAGRAAWLVYLAALCVVMLLLLEFVARQIGLGDPVLYYNAAWGGVRPLPNQQVERIGGARVTIDANGFRTAVGGSDGDLRVLFVGDSVLWGGSSVDDRDLLSEVAADGLRAGGTGVYAMNAAVNGTGLVNQSEIVRQLQAEVDAVVWLFPWGDVYRDRATVGNLWPARHKPRFASVELIDHAIRTRWLRWFREAPPPPEPFAPPNGPPGYEEFFDEVIEARRSRNLEAFEDAVGRALGGGVPVVVGVTPAFHRGALVELPPGARELLRTAGESGAVVFDVPAAIAASGRPPSTLFLDRVHLTSEGHRVVGEALGAVLADELERRLSRARLPAGP